MYTFPGYLPKARYYCVNILEEINVPSEVCTKVHKSMHNTACDMLCTVLCKPLFWNAVLLSST